VDELFDLEHKRKEKHVKEALQWMVERIGGDRVAQAHRR
jgi:hypothetical protein